MTRARDAGPGPGWGAMVLLVTAVLGRPDLWWSALGACRRLAAPGWWRERPHLPLPDRQLWRFRMTTAYGDPDAVPVPADVISYLVWCRATAHRHPAFGRSPTGPPGSHLGTGRSG